MEQAFCSKNIVCLTVLLSASAFYEFAEGRTLAKDADFNNYKQNARRPEVTIPQGILRGVNMLSRRNRTIYGFKAIPFAQPPIGELRFKSPLPPNPWNGTYDASGEINRCPQVTEDGTRVVGDEDCLYLNVYTPRLPTRKNSTLLPVMLYIHGSSFKKGTVDSYRYGPAFLLDKDVVFVISNYRLSVLGFLGTGDEVSPGNYALKDMVRALEWTRDNIRYFGGNPDKVTLFAASSGAICVHLLTLSNSTKGLFHKYITHSGSALTYTSTHPLDTYKNYGIKLGKHLGCPTNTSTLLVNCLRRLSVPQLIDTNSLFYEWKTTPDIVWGPTIEPDVEGALLTDSPINLFAAGKVRDLPWMSGGPRDEGLFVTGPYYRNPKMAEEFFQSIDSVLPFMLKYYDRVINKEDWTVALKSYYFNNLTANNDLLLRNFTDLVGDAIITYSAYDGFQQQLAIAKNPQYLYSFEYRGTFAYSYMFTGGSLANIGVAHGDDIIYLFQDSYYLFGPRHFKMNKNDLKMVDTMVELWTSFATTGIPMASAFNGTAVWKPFSSRNNYLRIGNGSDTSLEVKYNFLKDRMEFWDKLYADTIWL